MEIISGNTFAKCYNDAYSLILSEDVNDIEINNKKRKEVSLLTMEIRKPEYNLAFNPFRSFNLMYAILDSLSMIQYTANIDKLSRWNKNLEDFAEENNKLHSAYGRRVQPVINEVMYKLKQNLDSDEAVVSVFMSYYDIGYREIKKGGKGLFLNNVDVKDTPKTLNIIFKVRNGILFTTSISRSEDLIYETPYLIFKITNLIQLVKNSLYPHKLQLGTYTHIIDTAYIEEQNESYEYAKIQRGLYEPIKYEIVESLDQWRLLGNTVYALKNKQPNIDRTGRKNTLTRNIIQTQLLYERDLHVACEKYAKNNLPTEIIKLVPKWKNVSNV